MSKKTSITIQDMLDAKKKIDEWAREEPTWFLPGWLIKAYYGPDGSLDFLEDKKQYFFKESEIAKKIFKEVKRVQS